MVLMLRCMLRFTCMWCRKVNRDSTLVLARLAAESGVKRFVFLSSIKVNGGIDGSTCAFTIRCHS